MKALIEQKLKKMILDNYKAAHNNTVPTCWRGFLGKPSGNPCQHIEKNKCNMILIVKAI